MYDRLKIKPNIYTYEHLINYYTSARDYDKAIDMYQ